MTVTVRRLEADDPEAEVARRLGWEAFGVPADPPPGSPAAEPARLDRPGMTWFGAFTDEDAPAPGLVARMVDRAYDSCFGGVLLPTSGIAGVTVVAEARGRRALTPLFAATLASARERGAVLSTLFPTAPGIYRGFGYELVAETAAVELPTAALAAVRAPVTTRVRRAGVADVEAVREVYDRWAIEQNGPLSRRGVSFPATDEELLAQVTGLTVALDPDDRVVGYAAWNRGQGYGETAVLEVEDLLADDADARRALLRVLGSFASVAPTTRLHTSGDDLARLEVPSLTWSVRSTSSYMLRVLDVPGALAPRRYPRSLRVDLAFTVAGDPLPGLDGGYRLAVDDGHAECVRTGSGDPAARVLTPRGLALLYAGAQSSANLRATGHLTGGDRDEDLEWDALFGGRQRHIRDYF